MYMKVDHEPAFSDDNPSARLLRAVESIGRHGPMTYDALRADLGISKTATWRIVATLRECGWVRVRHGGRLLQLDPRLDDLFATTQYADREFTLILDDLYDVAKAHDVHVDVFTLGAAAEIVLTDTTRRLTVSVTSAEEPDETVTLILQAAMTPVQLARHLTRVLETADPDLASMIREGKAARRLRNLPGFAWSPVDGALCVVLRGTMGTPAALRIAPRSRKVGRAVIVAAFLDLQSRISGMVETLGKPGYAPR